MKARYLIAIVSTLYCSCSQQTKTDAVGQTETASQPEAKPIVLTVFKLDDMKYLLDSINRGAALDKKLSALGFHEKMTDVYISHEMASAKKPKHWVQITRMGRYSSVGFKTVNEGLWINLIGELKKLATPQKFSDGTSDIAQRYKLKGYTVETYEPVKGINLDLNNLYEVIIMTPAPSSRHK